MNIAIIITVVVVVGIVGYFLVTRSKTGAKPLPMSERSPVVATAPPGDVKATISSAATKATQNSALAGATSPRLALTLVPGG